MHRQAHQRVPFTGGEAKGVVQAQIWVGGTETFSVLEVVGPELNPGPFVAHKGTALAGQALQLPQRQGDAANHELPAPIEIFSEREPPRTFG